MTKRGKLRSISVTTHRFSGGTEMLQQSSLIVRLVMLVDLIPLPPQPPKPKRGRRKSILDDPPFAVRNRVPAGCTT